MRGLFTLGVCPSGQRERAVNPSAQPTEVRILPPPLSLAKHLEKLFSSCVPAAQDERDALPRETLP